MTPLKNHIIYWALYNATYPIHAMQYSKLTMLKLVSYGKWRSFLFFLTWEQGNVKANIMQYIP